ncbi:unhealthy ribosome biogenesis protein 2 homolog isoform X3 [Branchiostoma lanceolatum]|uniref:unhealthy ribosome biogenesis protein 2 homolog isoform X3 n=1 Tax=Branchiostoma lanceolatum TaxID=7740 RepID=UPI003454AF9B
MQQNNNKMAAPISGVHKRLKSSETPWREKLKLGRMAWSSRRVVLPRREQVLLDWATSTLIQHHTKKAVLEEQILQEMWLFLEDILKSTRLQTLARSGSIFLNSSFNQVITAILSNACQPEATHLNLIPTVLDCMEVILAQPTLAAVLLSRYDTCVELLKSMLCLTVRLCVADVQKSVPSLLSSLVTVLDKCSSLQRQQHKHTKVFQSVCEELLAPGACCCWVLSNHSKVPPSATSNFIIKIQEHIHQGLFFRENAPAFEKHLCDTTDSPSVGSKGVELYFQQLDQLLKNTVDPSMFKMCALPAGGIEDAILQYLPAAFNSFLTSPACADITRTGFTMLQTLYGFTLPLSTAGDDMETEKSQEEDSMDVDADIDNGEAGVKTQEKRLVAIRDLLQIALDLNIYRALDDTTSGGKQLAWLRQLLHTLLQIPPPATAARLDCVRLLLDMTHQVVAPRLADIWTCSWLLLDEDVAPAVQVSQDKLLCRLLETYAKLRQVDTLVVAMLDAVQKNQDQLSYSKTFPPVTLQRWSELVQGLPVGLAMEIWHRMLNKLQEQYQPAEKPQLECTPACLEQMTTLLSLFLVHLKLWDVNITSPMATRVDQLMASTCSSVISPLLKLCMETNKQVDKYLHFSALHLCHTWCQLHMLSTHMKGAKHSNEAVPNLGVNEEWWDFSVQYPDMSPGDWSTLCHKLATSKRIRYVLEMLCLQKVKMLRMLTRTSEQDTVKRRIENAINFVTVTCTTDEVNEHAWDGQVTSVTSNNYPTAHWYLLCSHIGLIAPVCTQHQLALLAHDLLQTVVSESCPKSSAGLVTRAMISADLLRSAPYLELLPMQEAMITAVISGLADIVNYRSTATVRLCVKVLQELSKDTHPESVITGPEEDTPPLSKAITSAVVTLQSLQKDVQKRCSVNQTKEQLQKMCCYFKVLKQVPLQCLSDISSVRCVLGCLAVNYLLGASHSMSDCATAVLRTSLEVLRDVMTGQKKTSLWQTLDAAVTMKCLLLTCQQTQLQDMSLSTAVKDTYQDLMYHLLWSVVRSAEGTSTLPSYTTHMCQALQSLSKSAAPRDGHRLDWLFISAGCTLSAGLMVTQNKVKVPAAQADIITSCTRQLAVCVAAVVPSVDLPAVTTAMAAALRVQMADSQVGEDWTPRIEHQVSSLKTMLTEIQDNLQNIRACLGFLKTVAGGVPKWQAVLPEEFGPTVYNLVVQLLLKIHSTNNKEPSESALSTDMAEVVAEAEALLLIVFRCSQPEQFSTYIQGLQQHLDCDTSVCAALQLWQLVLREEWKDEKRDSLNNISPQLVLQLQVLLQKSSSKVTADDVLKQIIVPSLLTTAAILQFGQGSLPDQVAGAALHGCLSVQIQNQPGSTFAATFHATCRVLTSLLLHHTKVARNAVPSLMACCRTLLVALVHEGRQDNGSVDSADVVLCAGDFGRLVAALVQKVDLTKIAAFLVAEYVNELQHGTLHPEVKKSLVPSVYLLLDVCGMHGSKLLVTALHPGLREIYKALHADYNRYHKYRGKV